MRRQHAEDLQARAEAQVRAEEQHAALMTATAAGHAAQLQALRERHAAEQQEFARYNASPPLRRPNPPRISSALCQCVCQFKR